MDILDEEDRGSEIFFTRIVPDKSMEPKLSEGDKIVLRRDIEAVNGDLVLCRFRKGDSTKELIRYYWQGTGKVVKLLSSLEGDSYGHPDVVLSADDILEVSPVIGFAAGEF